MLTLCLSFSCTKVVPTELSVTTTDLTFTKEGGSQTISFTTNKGWTATSSASWLKVTASGTSASTTISVTADANPDYDDRTATVTIKAEDKTQTVNVKQSTNIGLLISKKDYDLTDDAQSIEVEVQANIDFEYTIDATCKAWVTPTSTKALSTNKVYFNIAKNDSYDSRQGKIVFKQKDGNLTEVVTIIQGQKNAIIIADEKIEFEAKGDSRTVNIESNISYDVTISNDAKSWLSISEETKALSSSNITIHAAENATSSNRSGLVVVSGEKITKEISVTQKAGSISVNQTEFNLATAGGEFKFEVSHNISYKAEISEEAKSWITYNSSKSSDTELWYTVSKNESTDSRTGLVSIKNGDFDIPVTIKQAQKDSIFVNNDKVDVPLSGGTFSIDVSANVSISVEIEESAKEWLSQVQTKAMQESTLNFSVSSNMEMTSREGKIIITGSGIQKTISVNQAGPILVTGISLNQSSLKIFEGSTKEIKATVTPEDATYKDVEWATSNSAVATVEDGKVKAVTRGSATITAKCGGFSASCEITVLGEEDLNLTTDVWMQFTGTSLIVSGKTYYGRTYTIHNDSPVNVELVEIGTSNFQSIGQTLASGSTYSYTLYFSYNVYPKITLRFKYNNKSYEVYLENY